jgi:hypothetical protein
MLYQLSYASRSKPAKVITQALKLQAAHTSQQTARQAICQKPATLQLYTSFVQTYTEKVEIW